MKKSVSSSNLSLKSKILSIEARKVYELMPKRRDFPEWRAFVDYIRTMAGKSELDSVLQSIRKLDELQAARQHVPNVPTSLDQAA